MQPCSHATMHATTPQCCDGTLARRAASDGASDACRGESGRSVSTSWPGLSETPARMPVHAVRRGGERCATDCACDRARRTASKRFKHGGRCMVHPLTGQPSQSSARHGGTAARRRGGGAVPVDCTLIRGARTAVRRPRDHSLHRPSSPFGPLRPCVSLLRVPPDSQDGAQALNRPAGGALRQRRFAHHGERRAARSGQCGSPRPPGSGQNGGHAHVPVCPCARVRPVLRLLRLLSLPSLPKPRRA